MFINSLLLIILVISSSVLFFINNFYVILGLLIFVTILSLVFRVRLPLYLPFIILLLINFILNFWLSDIMMATMVTVRLIIMFISVNLIIKKIGTYNLAYTIGNLFRSKEITLIISIALSFIPIMIKELLEIRKSLITKNFPLNIKNVLRRPNVFIMTFFSNLFKRVSEMEKVLISKGVDE